MTRHHLHQGKSYHTLFTMSDPLAYFLTWATHGTWLHGDERGAVDRKHSQYDTSRIQPNATWVRWEQSRLKALPARLDEESRTAVEGAIRDHCRQRGWDLHAVAVRSKHVHVVVGYAGLRPEPMVGQFKAWATRRLREAGLIRPGTRVWGRHASTRYLWNLTAIRDAATYVEDGQDIEK
jgi:REP element-mobilizing transposase RayT